MALVVLVVIQMLPYGLRGDMTTIVQTTQAGFDRMYDSDLILMRAHEGRSRSHVKVSDRPQRTRRRGSGCPVVR